MPATLRRSASRLPQRRVRIPPLPWYILYLALTSPLLALSEGSISQATDDDCSAFFRVVVGVRTMVQQGTDVLIRILRERQTSEIGAI